MNFGGDFGASQFAGIGGGFVASQAGGDGYGGAAVQQKRGGNSQTLRAVTIRQIVKDVATTDDENYKVDGVELHTVTIVGRIVNVQDSATRFTLTVDDGTGRTQVEKWINEEQDLGKARSEWQVGTYVRVYGNVRAFGGKKNINAYTIRSVRDYNEVTYHFLQCTFQHLHITKGAAPAGAVPPSPMAYVAPSSGNAHPAQGYPSGNPSATMNYGAYNASTMPSANTTGSSSIHSEVLAIYNDPQHSTSDAGLSVEEVHRLLGNKYQLHAIMQAVEFLCNEGHLFTTVDDLHYRSCSSM